MIKVFPLDKESFFDFLPVCFLDHHFVLHELYIIINFRDQLSALFGVISMRLSDVVKPKCCMADLVKPHLKRFDLGVFGCLLFCRVAWINFQTLNVCLNLAGMVLQKIIMVNNCA